MTDMLERVHFLAHILTHIRTYISLSARNKFSDTAQPWLESVRSVEFWHGKKCD